MNNDAYRRLLGVADPLNPFALLGLAPALYRAGRIDIALQMTLAKLDRHPQAATPDGQEVRERVIEAARVLRDPTRRQPLFERFRPAEKTPEQELIDVSQPAPAAPATAKTRDASTDAELTARPPRPARPTPTAPAPVAPARSSESSAAAGAPAPSSSSSGGLASRTSGLAGLELTPFDRQVLAVLVSSGGWNHQSRARLVGIAAQHGVTVRGLIQVVTGLAQYAAQGGEALHLDDITGGAARLEPDDPVEASNPLLGDEPMPDGLVQRAAARQSSTSPVVEARPSGPVWSDPIPELRDEGPWDTIKLAALFSLATIFVAVVAVRFLMSSDRAARQEMEPPTLRAAEAVDPADLRPVTPPAPTQIAGDSVDGPIELVDYGERPTFRADRTTPAAIEAAARVEQLPDDFDLLARTLIVRQDEVGERFFREWETAINEAAVAWPLLSAADRQAIDEAALEVLYAAADLNRVQEELIDALAPQLGRIDNINQLWRDPWKAGFLAVIGRQPRLSPALIQRARGQLEAAAGDADLPTSPEFHEAASMILDGYVEPLVRGLEFDDDAYGKWELWLVAQDRLRGDDRRARGLVRAIRVILASEIDLTRTRPSVNVLSRLLAALDYRQSQATRVALLAALADSRLGADDLWAVTSLLALGDAAPWFDPALVIAPDSSDRTRTRKLERLAEAWPDVPGAVSDGVTPVLVEVDDDARERWRDAVLVIADQAAPPSQVAKLVRLLDATQLNLAAVHFEEDEIAAGLDVLDMLAPPSAPDDLEVDADAPPIGSGLGRGGSRRPPPGTGMSGGSRRRAPTVVLRNDGEWSDAYRAARGRLDEQRELIESLGRDAGGDLGPRDARLLVTLAYRGRSVEVRALAQSAIVSAFANGPNIALQLLDQAPDAPARIPVSEMIERVSGEILPEARELNWPYEMRLALLRHALWVRAAGSSEIDDLALVLREVLQDQLAAMNRGSDIAFAERTPEDAALRVAEAWRDRAARISPPPVIPEPASLNDLDQRHEITAALAQGPIEQHVARRIAALHFMAFEMTARDPTMRPLVRRTLDEALGRRSEASHVFDQATEVEYAIARLHGMRMGLQREAAWAEFWRNRP